MHLPHVPTGSNWLEQRSICLLQAGQAHPPPARTWSAIHLGQQAGPCGP